MGMALIETNLTKRRSGVLPKVVSNKPNSGFDKFQLNLLRQIAPVHQ